MRTSLFPLSLVAALVVFVVAGFTAPAAPDEAPATQPAAEVATWNVDQSHSRVGFKVRHLGLSNVSGQFHDYEVDLQLDPTDLSTLETSATINIASIDTENERRDNHLRSPDFFAAEEHPTMTFVSKEVRNIDGNSFELVGDLTIRGTTKEVVLDGEVLGTAVMQGNEIVALEASTTINRLEYGLAWDRLTEAGGVVVGHDVQIILELEAVKAEA